MEHGMSAGITDQLRIVGEDVWLTVPPFSEFLRTVRLVAADTASRAGLDYDEIEDFRIAVDELCHLLMSSTDQEISLSFGVMGHSVVARGRATRRHGAPLAPLGELSRTIIDSVADFHETYEHDAEMGFSVLKESRAPAVEG
jgi:hypothetical protein